MELYLRRRLAFVFLAALFTILALTQSSPSAVADIVPANGFNVVSLAWGTATTSASPSPGDQNVPLTVTLQYYFYNSATAVQARMDMSAGFTAYGGGSDVIAYQTGTVTSGSIIQLTFYVNIDSNTQLGSYTFPLTITWGAVISSSQSVSQIQSTQATVSLRGRPQLIFSAVQKSLAPGQVNDVTFVLSNQGTGPATGISTTVSVSSGSILGSVPTLTLLAANATFTLDVSVYVPATAAGAALTFTFTATYKDGYAVSQTVTSTVGAYAASGATSIYQLSVNPVSNTVSLGSLSSVSFLIRNTGSSTFYSPTVTLTVPTPLVVAANSSVSFQGVSMDPGFSLVYAASVTSNQAASTQGGIYVGTLAVTYKDQFGNTGTQDVPVTFILINAVNQVAVNQLSSEVALGGGSPVSLLVTNVGTASLNSPIISLAVPSPLAVTANSTLSEPGLVLKPGGGLKYVAMIAAGPKAAEGAYTGTLTVTFNDQFGNARTSTFTVGLVVVGGIQLVLQNERVSRNGTTVFITGTLLNEGLANAYYTQLTASLTVGSAQVSTATQYVGEVDPNTPLPVSLTMTIPQAALNATGSLALTANYQNDYGQALQFKSSHSVSLSGGAAAGGPPLRTTTPGAALSDGTANLTRYALLLAILVAAAASVVYIRRRRSKGRRAGSAKSDVY